MTLNQTDQFIQTQSNQTEVCDSNGVNTIESILEAPIDGLLVVTSDLEIVEWDEKTFDILGFSREEMLGKDLISLANNKDAFQANQSLLNDAANPLESTTVTL